MIACTSWMAMTCSRPGRWTSGVGEALGQRSEGAASVGDDLLLGEGHLRERSPVTVVGDEDGGVAEALVAAGLDRDAAVDRAFGDHLSTVREAGQGNRAESGPTVVFAFEVPQQLGDVVRVGR